MGRVPHLLDHVQVRRAGAPHVDQQRLDQGGFREILELLGHRRAEEDGLTLTFEFVDDVVHLLVEPQVQHAVALVQHHVLANVHVEAFLVQQVVQAPRGGDDAVHALVRRHHRLHLFVFPPDAQGRAELREPARFERLQVPLHDLPHNVWSGEGWITTTTTMTR